MEERDKKLLKIKRKWAKVLRPGMIIRAKKDRIGEVYVWINQVIDTDYLVGIRLRSDLKPVRSKQQKRILWSNYTVGLEQIEHIIGNKPIKQFLKTV